MYGMEMRLRPQLGARPRYRRFGQVPARTRRQIYERNRRRTIRLTISGILTIATDILNLAEQFVVFAQIPRNSSKDFQLRFLIFVTALAGANLIKSLFNSRRVRLVLCIVSDTIEFGIYYALLQHTTGFFVATIIFYTIEVALHIVNFVVTGETKTRRSRNVRIIDGGVQFAVFFFCNAIPFTTLFMTDGSEFRKDYFEYILILNIYLGTAGVEILSEIATKYIVYLRNRVRGQPRPKFYDISEDDVQIVQYYAWIKFVISIVVNFITMPVLIFILSVVQVWKRDPNLPRYDRNAQIALASFIGFYFCLVPCCIPLFIVFIYYFVTDYEQHVARR